MSPEAIGLSPVGRRRTSGLRREEVADAAGISANWYIRLEQGRDVRASVHALSGISRALRLSAPERAYLMSLARPDLNWKDKLSDHGAPSPGLCAVLEGLGNCPAYILNRYWQVKRCNKAARALFGDIDDERQWDANLVARLFLDSNLRCRFSDWPRVAGSVVAQLRLSLGNMSNDAVMQSVIDQLCAASPEFDALWNSGELSEPPMWQKEIIHPDAGPLVFDFAGLRASGQDSSFTVAIHTPADAETRKRLAEFLAD